jgi:hypothetical protein
MNFVRGLLDYKKEPTALLQTDQFIKIFGLYFTNFGTLSLIDFYSKLLSIFQDLNLDLFDNLKNHDYLTEIIVQSLGDDYREGIDVAIKDCFVSLKCEKNIRDLFVFELCRTLIKSIQ